MRYPPARNLWRQGWVVAFVLLGLLLIPQAAPAHPPSDMQLAFDRGTRILSVTITHTVADPTTHFVKRVRITAGGSQISNNTYTSQPSPSSFTYTFQMPPSAGGEIQVVAECSILGSTTRSIQIPEGMGAGSPAPGTTLPGQVSGTGTPPIPPGAPPGTRATPPAASPATTAAPAGLLPLAAALALAGWRLRR